MSAHNSLTQSPFDYRHMGLLHSVGHITLCSDSVTVVSLYSWMVTGIYLRTNLCSGAFNGTNFANSGRYLISGGIPHG